MLAATTPSGIEYCYVQTDRSHCYRVILAQLATSHS